MPGSGRDLVVRLTFLEELQYWMQQNPRMAARVLALMQAVARDPFTGIGKPELLRRVDPNTWSRRSNQEHRLIYMVLGNQVQFLTARRHYTDR